MYLVIDLNLIGNLRKIKSIRANSFLCYHVKLNGIRKMRRKVEAHIDLNILIKAITLRMLIRIAVIIPVPFLKFKNNTRKLRESTDR